jgi:hypothetical protein
MGLLPGQTNNMWGPVPFSDVGLIIMQPLVVFQSTTKPLITQDGNGLIITKGGALVLLNQNGETYPLPSPITTGNDVGGTQIAPAWMDSFGRIRTANYEALPNGFVTGQTSIFGISDNTSAIRLYLADKAGQILATQYSLPNQELAEGTQLSVNWFVNPFSPQYPTDGGTVNAVYTVKFDDYGQEQGLYWVGSNTDLGTLPDSANSINYDINLSHTPDLELNVPISGFDQSGVVSFKAALVAAGNYIPAFQVNQFAGNFPSDLIVGPEANPTLCLPGLNCLMYDFADFAAGQLLPPRMAQDCYLAGLVTTEGGTTGATGQQDGTTGPIVIPTRLLNSATYAQALFQPGLAFNESMTQFGVTEIYPQMQLPTIGFFGSNGSVKYYNVLPQDFVALDIVDGPDLLWASPSGAVMAVFHDTAGNYYFTIGGTRSTYQTAVYNYRYSYTPGG